MNSLCRDCGSLFSGPADCPACGSSRTVTHPELASLTIAHVDSDAFYAAIEQRDNPELRGKPVIVGGASDRGVVAACSYESRPFGVRSAMPIGQARRLCPSAIVVKPNMEKYRAASLTIRKIFLSMTPLVEPASLDEAYLDFSGTERYHKRPAAAVLAEATRTIEREVGVTVSVGLSYNKGLAKIASDRDKPRGFSVIGRAEAVAFLRDQPPSIVNGIGPVLAGKLSRDGFTTIGSLQAADERDLMRRYGPAGLKLARFARGEDSRKVEPDRPTKSLSSETTFERDIKDGGELLRMLWPLCEKVSKRLKRGGHSGRTVVVKMKTADHKTFSRNKTLDHPTQLASKLYEIATPIVGQEANGRAFRLIGIGVSDLDTPAAADPRNLLEGGKNSPAAIERVVDAIRGKLGDDAIKRAWQIE